MNIDELAAKFRDLPANQFEEKLDYELRHNLVFRNLDEKNRQVVEDLVRKYREKIRLHGGISHYDLRDELHKLYENRIALNLMENDLDDIKEIMTKFSK